MGLFDMVRGQLIDVIEWTDDSGDTLVHKYDMNGKDIMMGAQLTVRESQAAVFVDESLGIQTMGILKWFIRML